MNVPPRLVPVLSPLMMQKVQPAEATSELELLQGLYLVTQEHIKRLAAYEANERAERRTQDRHQQRLLRGIIRIVDHVESFAWRMKEAGPEDQRATSETQTCEREDRVVFADFLQRVHRLLNDVLRSSGAVQDDRVACGEVLAGPLLDLCEVVDVEDQDDYPELTVLHIVHPGYRLDSGHVLRPAEVIVSRRRDGSRESSAN